MRRNTITLIELVIVLCVVVVAVRVWTYKKPEAKISTPVTKPTFNTLSNHNKPEELVAKPKSIDRWNGSGYYGWKCPNCGKIKDENILLQNSKEYNSLVSKFIEEGGNALYGGCPECIYFCQRDAWKLVFVSSFVKIDSVKSNRDIFVQPRTGGFVPYPEK